MEPYESLFTGMTLLPDHLWYEAGIIRPWAAKNPVGISSGQGSMGYDLTLGVKFIELIPSSSRNAEPFDPMEPSAKHLGPWTEKGEGPFPIGAGSYLLAEVHEHITMPSNCLGIVIGKSTYARAGILINVTPIEPGWRGVLTLEIANLTKRDVLLYPGLGICQLLVFVNDWERRPVNPYGGGKYQDQKGVTPGRLGSTGYKTWECPDCNQYSVGAIEVGFSCSNCHWTGSEADLLAAGKGGYRTSG